MNIQNIDKQAWRDERSDETVERRVWSLAWDLCLGRFGEDLVAAHLLFFSGARRLERKEIYW